jgi:hypothetical protein
MRVVAASLVLVLLAAGCGGKDDRDPTTTPATTGTVEGVVRDEAGSPLYDATVRILLTDRSGNTDHDGRYRIEQVPAGAIRVVASKNGYASATSGAQLAPAATVRVDLALRAAPSVIPFDETLVFDGQILCALPQRTQCPTGPDASNATHRFETHEGLHGLVLELAWTSPAPAASDRLALDLQGATETACGARYANAEGPSPVAIVATQGYPLHGGHGCATVRAAADSAAIELLHTLCDALLPRAAPRRIHRHVDLDTARHGHRASTRSDASYLGVK